MLQREVPDEINILVARLASEAGIPVIMDVGGHDRPLDPDLMPYISVIAPNESTRAQCVCVLPFSENTVYVASVREYCGCCQCQRMLWVLPVSENAVCVASVGECCVCCQCRRMLCVMPV